MASHITPRVFVSAVSGDLRSARKVVNEALTQIGCLPVEESINGTEYGPIRKMLQRWMESCDAVIHLVGCSYGGEPAPQTLPTGHPRRSWTQIEYDLARKLGKKTYVIVCEESFPFDSLHTPESAEKSAMQVKHRQAVLDGEYLWHSVQETGDLRQRILELRLPLEEIRSKLRQQQSRNRLQTGLVVAAVFLVLIGVIYGLKSVQETVRQLTDPQGLAAAFRVDIEAATEAKIAALANEPGRGLKIAAIEEERDRAVGHVDDLIQFIQETLKQGANPVFQRASEILEQEGIDATLAYLQSRKPTTLETARRHAEQAEAAMVRAEAEKERRNRALQALILEGDLRETKLDWPGALYLRQQVAELAPDWFVARAYLGKLLYELARYREAEPHFRAVLALATTPDEEAFALNELAQLLQTTNRLTEAELLMRRALVICEQSNGAKHADVAIYLGNLGRILQDTSRLAEAEPLLRRVVGISENPGGEPYRSYAGALNNLAGLFLATNRLADAEPLMRRALAVFEQSHGAQHTSVAVQLNNLAGLLQLTNRLTAAEPLYRRALAIFELSYGSEHSKVADLLNNLAELLKATNRLSEAEQLLRRALVIGEQFYGSQHPNVAASLNNLAELMRVTNRPAEAEPLYRRALAIVEQTYGAEHPDVALYLNNLALLLQTTNRLAEVEPLYRRALAVFATSLAEDHPSTISARKNYRALLVYRDVPPDEIEQRIREAMETVGPFEPIVPYVERLPSRAKSVTEVLAEVLAALDVQYIAEAKRVVHVLPPSEPIAPHLDELLGPSTLNLPLDQPIASHLEKLLGPAKPFREVFDAHDRQHRKQGRPSAWLLPLDEPISPHLDELLGPALEKPMQ